MLSEISAQLPPEAVVLQHVAGGFVAQAVYVAAKLNIADLLAEKPKTVAELAAATNTHERSLYRLLRTLASIGVFEETDPQVFGNNPASATLREDVKGSTRNMALWLGSKPHWDVYAGLEYSVQTGKPAWDYVHGEPVFPYLFETNKELGNLFNHTMTSFSHSVIPALNEAYDFSEIKTLADIAGGYGHLLAGVLKENPHMRGVLFELPNVLEGATEFLKTEGVTDRVETVSGSFWESVPVKADAYMLKFIIHDWNDEQCVQILSHIRAVMPANAKLLLVEAVLPEGNEANFAKIIDLEMLISPGGMERTATEFDTLLEKAGFSLSRIIPTKSMVSIVEAVKA
jgi:C-methyltransferase